MHSHALYAQKQQNGQPDEHRHHNVQLPGVKLGVPDAGDGLELTELHRRGAVEGAAEAAQRK